MKLQSKHLTLWYVIYAIIFALVITGLVDRRIIFLGALLLAYWSLLAPLESAVLMFVQCIPLFTALPLSATFDNFNLWRPIALIIFARLIAEPTVRASLARSLRLLYTSPLRWARAYPIGTIFIILTLGAALSLLNAAHVLVGIKRYVLIMNAALVPMTLWALIRMNRLSVERVIESIATPIRIVVVVGFLQLLSTYLIDVYQFMRIWGEGIQRNQFGTEWSYIATHVGNTWLAYYGNQLSLRVFSLFPDSHSFPSFVLIGLPALLALGATPIIRKAQDASFMQMARTYAAWSILWVPAAYLAIILSGTRGMWVGAVVACFLVLLYRMLLWRSQITELRKKLFSYASAYLIAFFLLFGVAWPIFISPQFLLGKQDISMFGNRIRSVLDFGETSNSLRIEIWKQSLGSIARHPFLGVGLGNFPVVLEQDIELGRAGSTAHNLYLHVAAEMGVASLVVVVLLCLRLWHDVWVWFRESDGVATLYSAGTLLSLPWFLAYMMTDPIVFDERVLLLFSVICALVWSATPRPSSHAKS